MQWYLISLIAIVGFSIANACIRFMQTKISPFASLPFFVIGSLVAALVGLLASRFFSKDQFFSLDGVFIALAAGFVWAIGEFFLFIMLTISPLTLAIPLIVGGIGIGGVITGVLFFQESLTVPRIIGVLIVLLGSVILARS